MPVFGPLRRNGRVYTRIVRDVSRKTLRQIIRTKVIPESVIYTDSFRSYDGLVLDGFKHYRINHQETFATSRRHHINGIENFWGRAKSKLKSYYGVSRNQFYFYLSTRTKLALTITPSQMLVTSAKLGGNRVQRLRQMV